MAVVILDVGGDLVLAHRMDRAAYITPDVAPEPAGAHPEGEHDVNASWQGMQYLVSMLQSHSEQLDNDRYPGLSWATPQAVLAPSR